MRKIKRKIKKLLTYVILGITLGGIPIGGQFIRFEDENVVNASRSVQNIVQNIESVREIDLIQNETETIKGVPKVINTDFPIPEYIGETRTIINSNIPYFEESEKITDAFEIYSNLDKYGRCGIAYANLCEELMPTDERGEIGHIKPSGWHTVKYNDIIEDVYLYNRCHLIGFQLAGENDNEKNLITGTRWFNVEGMLPLENMVADYIHETGNHVLFRVTPCYEGTDLVCKGVLMEAYSVEDNGTGICFCQFIHNIQPGINIEYATGKSWEKTE